jgi:MoaA/NifB/PqqE/SkfB family radical SAM enzyme
MGFEGFPFIVGWELTLACDLRCRHCGSTAGRPRPNELSLDRSLALCDEFPALAVKEVDFTGGEPLLRKDWWRIAARVAENGITTRIVTNGQNLNPDVLGTMVDVGISTVGVSLDGVESTHDAIRCRPGAWRKSVDGIARAAASGLKVGVITAVNALNVKQLPLLLDFLPSVGVSHWQIQPNLPPGPLR